MRPVLLSAFAGLAAALSNVQYSGAPRLSLGDTLPNKDEQGHILAQALDHEVARPSCNGGTSANGRSIAYYQSWNVRSRLCDKVWPSQIKLDGLTHLNLAFASVDPKTFKIRLQNPADEEVYRQFTKLKDRGVQTWLGVGGWEFSDPGETRTTWSDVASAQANRQAFIDSVIPFLKQYGFQGMDIDWEWPSTPNRGGRPEDKQNQVLLLKELRAALKTDYGLSLVIPHDNSFLGGFDINGLAEHVDWFNVLTYDLHGPWDSYNPALGSTLRAHTNLVEIDQHLEALWATGIEPKKFTLGLAYYGRGYTLADTNCNHHGCGFSGPSAQGNCSVQVGMLSGCEIKRIIKDNSLTPTLIPDGVGAMEVSWNNQWMSFDNDQTFAMKKKLANDRCMSGTAIWAIDYDSCDANGSLPPLGPIQSSASSVTPPVSVETSLTAVPPSAEPTASQSSFAGSTTETTLRSSASQQPTTTLSQAPIASSARESATPSSQERISSSLPGIPITLTSSSVSSDTFGPVPILSTISKVPGSLSSPSSATLSSSTSASRTEPDSSSAESTSLSGSLTSVTSFLSGASSSGINTSFLAPTGTQVISPSSVSSSGMSQMIPTIPSIGSMMSVGSSTPSISTSALSTSPAPGISETKMSGQISSNTSAVAPSSSASTYLSTSNGSTLASSLVSASSTSSASSVIVPQTSGQGSGNTSVVAPPPSSISSELIVSGSHTPGQPPNSTSVVIPSLSAIPTEATSNGTAIHTVVPVFPTAITTEDSVTRTISEASTTTSNSTVVPIITKVSTVIISNGSAISTIVPAVTTVLTSNGTFVFTVVPVATELTSDGSTIHTIVPLPTKISTSASMTTPLPPSSSIATSLPPLPITTAANLTTAAPSQSCPPDPSDITNYRMLPSNFWEGGLSSMTLHCVPPCTYNVPRMTLSSTSTFYCPNVTDMWVKVSGGNTGTSIREIERYTCGAVHRIQVTDTTVKDGVTESFPMVHTVAPITTDVIDFSPIVVTNLDSPVTTPGLYNWCEAYTFSENKTTDDPLLILLPIFTKNPPPPPPLTELSSIRNTIIPVATCKDNCDPPGKEPTKPPSVDPTGGPHPPGPPPGIWPPLIGPWVEWPDKLCPPTTPRGKKGKRPSLFGCGCGWSGLSFGPGCPKPSLDLFEWFFERNNPCGFFGWGCDICKFFGCPGVKDSCGILGCEGFCGAVDGCDPDCPQFICGGRPPIPGPPPYIRPPKPSETPDPTKDPKTTRPEPTEPTYTATASAGKCEDKDKTTVTEVYSMCMDYPTTMGFSTINSTSTTTTCTEVGSFRITGCRPLNGLTTTTWTTVRGSSSSSEGAACTLAPLMIYDDEMEPDSTATNISIPTLFPSPTSSGGACRLSIDDDEGDNEPATNITSIPIPTLSMSPTSSAAACTRGSLMIDDDEGDNGVNSTSIPIPTLSISPPAAACTRAPLNLDDDEGDNDGAPFNRTSIGIPTLSMSPTSFVVSIPTLSISPSSSVISIPTLSISPTSSLISIPTLSMSPTSSVISIPTLFTSPTPSATSNPELITPVFPWDSNAPLITPTFTPPSSSAPTSSAAPSATATHKPIYAGGKWTIQIYQEFDDRNKGDKFGAESTRWTLVDPNGFTADEDVEYEREQHPGGFAPGSTQIGCRMRAARDCFPFYIDSWVERDANSEKEAQNLRFKLEGALPNGVALEWDILGKIADSARDHPVEGYPKSSTGCDGDENAKWASKGDGRWGRNFSCYFVWLGAGQWDGYTDGPS